MSNILDNVVKIKYEITNHNETKTENGSGFILPEKNNNCMFLITTKHIFKGQSINKNKITILYCDPKNFKQHKLLIEFTESDVMIDADADLCVIKCEYSKDFKSYEVMYSSALCEDEKIELSGFPSEAEKTEFERLLLTATFKESNNPIDLIEVDGAECKDLNENELLTGFSGGPFIYKNKYFICMEYGLTSPDGAYKNVNAISSNYILKIICEHFFDSEEIDSYFDVISSKTNIINQNEFYREKYKAELSFENKYTDKKARLCDVFVQPVITESKFEDYIINWRDKKDEPILILSGVAGIGKSSSVMYIVSNQSKFPNVHSIRLRNKDNVDNLNCDEAWETLKKCLTDSQHHCIDDNKLDGSLIILDGLDELCILSSNFNTEIFFHNLLQKDLQKKKIKILITTRPGYCQLSSNIDQIITKEMTWDDECVKQWCDKYTDKHPNLKSWHDRFVSDFEKLPAFNKKNNYYQPKEHDNRRELYRIPIILYLCSIKDINIKENSTVGGLYRIIFNEIIGERQHDMHSLLKQKHDINLQEISYAYIKNFAYRMFINKSLFLTNEDVTNVKDYTKKNDVKSELTDNCSEYLEKYAGVDYFQYQNNAGIEFVHKSIYEYFTARKLFDDFFGIINKKTEVDEFWKLIIQALSYIKIEKEIFNFLIQIIKEEIKKEEYDDWKNGFLFNYYKGIADSILVKLIWTVDSKNYGKTKYSVLDNIFIVFRNLTYILSGIGFNNRFDKKLVEEKELDKSKYYFELSKFFFTRINMDLDCHGWVFESMRMASSDLCDSNFIRSNFYNVDLSNSNLSGCIFTNSKFKDVNFIATETTSVDFTNCEMDRCAFVNIHDVDNFKKRHNSGTLSSSNLSYANFKECELSNLDLCETNCDNTSFIDSKLFYIYTFSLDFFDKTTLTNCDIILNNKDFFDNEKAIKKYYNYYKYPKSRRIKVKEKK